jgi:membrane-bound metal-dependent hydrolase YbcI (DUF457 family)
MPTGHTHAMSGAVAYLALSGTAAATAVPWAYIPAPPSTVAAAASLFAGAAVCAGAAVLPDIDCAHSTMARSLGFITEAFALLLTKVLGVKHRHGTHSWVGVGVFTLIAWALGVFRDGMPGLLHGSAERGVMIGDRILLVLMLTVLLAAMLCIFRVKGHLGDLAALALALVMARTGWGLGLVPAAVAVGTITHIAGDSLTKEGCPWLWPFTDRHFWLPFGLAWPRFLRFTTDHWFERYALTGGLSLALAWLTLIRLGATALPGAGLVSAGALLPPRMIDPGRDCPTCGVLDVAPGERCGGCGRHCGHDRGCRAARAAGTGLAGRFAHGTGPEPKNWRTIAEDAT